MYESELDYILRIGTIMYGSGSILRIETKYFSLWKLKLRC